MTVGAQGGGKNNNTVTNNPTKARTKVVTRNYINLTCFYVGDFLLEIKYKDKVFIYLSIYQLYLLPFQL